jgi:hypothetical protein
MPPCAATFCLMPARVISPGEGTPIPFAACAPTGTYVFVSYAHANSAMVYPELTRIAGQAVRVWYDEGITPSREWSDEIANAIDLAALFIVMITPEAVASPNVRNEITYALRHRKDRKPMPLLAIHLRRTHLPGGVELQLGSVQAILRWQLDATSYDRKLSAVLAPYAQADRPPRPVRTSDPQPRRARAQVTPAHPELARFHCKDLVRAVAFSPDGALLATASGKLARLWHIATGRELISVRHARDLVSLAFSPGGERLATTSGDMAQFWDVATGREVGRLPGRPPSMTFWRIAYSPDGTRMVTGGAQRFARIWDVRTCTQIVVLDHKTGLAAVSDVAYNRNGSRIATSTDKTARIWNAASGRELLRLSHQSEVKSVAFSPDGSQLATASSEGIQVWDAVSGQVLTTLTSWGRAPIAFSQKDSRVAGCDGSEVHFWHIGSGRELGALDAGAEIYSLAYSPDGTRLATGGPELAQIWT